MKIYLEAYDKYRKCNLKINLCDGRDEDDCWWLDTFSSNEAWGKMPISITSDNEDPHLYRWSDLENIKLVVK